MYETKNNMIKKILRLFLSSILLILLICLWEFCASKKIINTIYFPRPSAVFLQLFHLLFNNPDFTMDIYSSLKRLLIGTLIAVPPAILLGIAVGLNKTIDLLSKSCIAVTYPVPKLAVFPLLLLLFGIGDASKIALIAIGIFFLVLLNTIHGVQRLASSGYFDIVRVYRIPFLKKLIHIVLRGVLPEILEGVKIGMGYGLVMIVASEFTASRNGIGLFMWNAWDQFRVKDMYCGLFVLSMTGLLIFYFFDTVKQHLKGYYRNF